MARRAAMTGAVLLGLALGVSEAAWAQSGYGARPGPPRRSGATDRPRDPAFQPPGGDPDRARVLFAEAERLRALGQTYDALEAYRRILDEQADFPELKVVIDRVYEIGLAYLEEKAERPFLFFQIKDSELGVEVLENLIERFEQPRFDFARFSIAESYFADEEFAKAAVHYELLQEDYPDSVWVGVARYQRAICYRRLSRGYEYDDKDMRRAEELLLDYLRRYPRGNRVREAEEALREIRGQRARLYLQNARYYLRREDSPRAALIYAEAVVREAPGSEAYEELPDLLRAIAARRDEDPVAAEGAKDLIDRLARSREEAERRAREEGALPLPPGVEPRPEPPPPTGSTVPSTSGE